MSSSLHHATAPDRAYTIDALTAEGFTPRQIRRLIWRGVLPRAHGHAPNAHYYSDLHLEMLRRIAHAADERRTRGDLRDMIALGTEP